MRRFALGILLCLSVLLATAQTIPPPAPKRLAPSELVKITTWGGMTRKGPAWSQTVITNTGEIRGRSQRGNILGKLTRRELQTLRRLMRSADWRAIRRVPYKESHAPSAVDGTDLVLAFRYGRRIESWANFEHERPEKAPLFQALAQMLSRHKVFLPL